MNAISNLAPPVGLACPRCGSAVSLVKDSRPTTRGIRRRRKCFACAARFVTIENLYDKYAALTAEDLRVERARTDTLKLLETLSPAEARMVNAFLRLYTKGSKR